VKKAEIADTIAILVEESETGFITEYKTNIVTIQPPPNQLDNIDFDVIGTSDY